MMSKVLSTISILGVLGLISYKYLQAVKSQQKIQAFVAQGPRFTAPDGQELCERVKALEAYSYGYRDAGRKPLDCSYNQKGSK